MTTAFVLSGGASLGAVQVGMLDALAERGITPDLVLGTSVGAVNGAWLAGHPGSGELDHLAAIWTELRTRNVFPLRASTALRALSGRSSALVSAHALRKLLARHLTFSRLEDAPVPFYVVATDVLTGEEVLLGRGDAVEAIVASAAIPGIFPPVEIDGQKLIDGGVVNNSPISHAVELGAETVYVLPSGYACALEQPPRHPVAMLLHATSLLIQQRLIQDVEHYDALIDLRVVPRLCPLEVSPFDFSHGEELIARARAATRRWLEHGPPRSGQARLLSFRPSHGEPHDSPIPGTRQPPKRGTVASITSTVASRSAAPVQR